MSAEETVTLTLSPEHLQYALAAVACLSYPFWGAVTAGLWGRRLEYTKPLASYEKFELTLLALTWPATLPLLTAFKFFGSTYSRLTLALLPEEKKRDA